MATTEKPKFTDERKAMWAIAYASVTRTRSLTPALRKAYGTGDAPPDTAALKDAELYARSIHIALCDACRLAGVEPHPQRQAPA